MGQNPRNLEYRWGFLCFAVGKRTAAISGKYFYIALVSKLYFFQMYFKTNLFKMLSCFFFSSMHPCIERRVDVFRSINDFKNLFSDGERT